MQLFFFVAIILWPGIIYGQAFGPDFIKDVEQKYCSEKRNDREAYEQCLKNAFYSLQPIYKSHEKNIQANNKKLSECLGFGEESDEELDSQLFIKCIRETGLYTNKQIAKLEASVHQPGILFQALQNPSLALQLSGHLSDLLYNSPEYLEGNQFPNAPCYDAAKDADALYKCAVEGGPSPHFIRRFSELHNVRDNQEMKECFEENKGLSNMKKEDPYKIMTCLTKAARNEQTTDAIPIKKE